MKKVKQFSFIFLFILVFVLGIVTVSADMGPKPATYITIKGIEGEYVACFAAKESWGPNFDYQDYLEYRIDYLEYHPIMEYQDEDGFKWITSYQHCTGEDIIDFTYYCPDEFKIVIYKNEEFYVATEQIEMYAFSTYYEIDFSNNEIKITKTYNYSSEIINLIIRIILTLLIEIGLFFLLRLYSKRNFLIVLIVNVITQLFLNIMLNIKNYNNGSLSAMLLLFELELIILIIEFIAYQILLKEKKRWLIIIYSIIANILSFLFGLYIFNQLV